MTRYQKVRHVAWLAAAVVIPACAGGAARPPDRGAAPAPTAAAAAVSVMPVRGAEPILPPQVAMLAGLLPVRSIGADSFRLANPTYDGRGVVIGILDSGLDPALPGLRRTTIGSPKILDVRDFSGEGRIALEPVRPDGADTVEVAGVSLAGLARVGAFARGPYYAGVLEERRLGNAPAADVNGDGDADDRHVLVVARAATGWVVMADTDGDGSLIDERPVHDYSVAGETLAFGDAGDALPPVTMAVNFAEVDGEPVLDLVFDTSGHGSHVAGIAAGHDLFGVEGFEGVAPGAHLLGLKISNNLRGGISVSGSMVRAMAYAAAYAEQRGMPLVLNLSFGVGNELEGAAAIDSLVDAFARAHPDVLVVISAGNDGPGISTIGFPGSAEQALSVCGLFPGVFARPPRPGEEPAADLMGWWSARGGETSKPDVCAPGLAFSNVPPWSAGEEISGGTSMAAPQLAGAAALLLSALRQSGETARAIDLKRAVMATAVPLQGTTTLDEGRGVPNVGAALRWLRASHQSGMYAVRALADGGNTSASSAAYRREGLADPADTVQHFSVTSVGGQPAARIVLSSDVPWLHAPAVVEMAGAPVAIPVTYDASALREPGMYVGTVWARAASDTMAGPAFALTNTVIVPHRLDAPFSAHGILTPGAVTRYFLAVPEGAGGLGIDVHVRWTNDNATLYLFEPDGRPYRGELASVNVGRDSTRARLTVSAEDLQPGVYEAVLVAPPLDAAQYEITAGLPVVAIEDIGSGPSVRVRAARATSASVRAAIVGAQRRVAMQGREGLPASVEVDLPAWAGGLRVDVTVDAATWQQVTDFGVTLYDREGRYVMDGPLNYAHGRLAVPLDSLRARGPLTVELVPAFADSLHQGAWSAEVGLVFLRRKPVALPMLGSGTNAADVEVPARRSIAFQLEPVPAELELPGEAAALVEVVVQPAEGPPSVRRETVGR